MKQMTKKELIEYFIEQLGNNEILGQVMSIESIREKLNNVIKDVTYHDEPGNFAGGWVIDEKGTGTVNFDIRKISLREEKQIIVHELLHALSTSSKTQKVGKYYTDKLEKCGIHFLKRSYRNDNYKIAYDESNNIAINEGMTDTLAEMITGVNHDGYNTEKDIYKIIATIVGEDTMLREYFSESISDENSIFQRGLVEKYGDILGEDINTDLIKVLYLSDHLLNLNRNDVIHGLNEKGKAIQGKTRDEIGNTLGNMIERIIDNEQDFTKKFEILAKFKNAEYIISFDIIRRISKKIQNELINSNDIDYTKKLEMIRILTSHFEKDSIEEIIFNIPEARQLTPEERLQNGMYLLKGKDTQRYTNILYRLYVENGKISEEQFSKKEIFMNALTDEGMDRIEDIESIDAILNRTIYRKMGRLIIASDDQNRDMNVSIFSNVFNEKGQRLNFQKFLNTKWRRRNAI
jgi:hypothetical protein